MAAHMARAEERADAVAAEILQTTGRYGALADTHVLVGAKLTEMGLCFIDGCDTSTKAGRREALLARAVVETGLRALREARNICVSAAQLSPDDKTDPVDAFLPPLEEPDDL